MRFSKRSRPYLFRLIRELEKKLWSERKRNINLVKELIKKDKNIDELRKLVKLYESISDLSRKELLDAYETIKAQEAAQELSRRELRERDEIIEAVKSVMDLSRQELLERETMIKVYESLTEMANKELAEAEEMIQAYEIAEEMALKELMQRENIINKVVSREIARELVRKGINLGGEKRFVSVMFVDIRGFTSISENLEPERVVEILNTYMGEMVKVVEKFGGTVDKFIGDGIMVVFGVPVSLGEKEDALRSVKTAVAMRNRLKELGEFWKSKNLPFIASGFGINSGWVVAGNMGTENRITYTVIGDTVNIASRLCDHAPPMKILISKSTYDMVKDEVIAEKIFPVHLKGKSHAVEIYDMKDLKDLEKEV